MTREKLFEMIREFCKNSKYNYVPAREALQPQLAGIKIYEDEILIGAADADDPIFEEFKKDGIIGPLHKTPSEWLPGARSVVSMFFPYEHSIVEANDKDPEPATPVWLHARAEGQIFMDKLCLWIVDVLEKEGRKAVCPSLSPQFKKQGFVSNWSERHAAYAAGLGTFGLHRGLITEKGTAGRFCSIITDMVITPTCRLYSDPFEYCIMCGRCAVKCPCGAIFPEEGPAIGKHQDICGPYVDRTHQPPAPPSGRIRYGCAKCMSGTPCAFGIPENCLCMR